MCTHVDKMCETYLVSSSLFSFIVDEDLMVD